MKSAKQPLSTGVRRRPETREGGGYLGAVECTLRGTVSVSLCHASGSLQLSPQGAALWSPKLATNFERSL